MKISLNNPPAEFRNPANSETTCVDIELTSRCNGAQCGITSEDGEEMPPIQPTHLHIKVTGDRPQAGPWYYAVALEQIE